jgi:hypothetical protein
MNPSFLTPVVLACVARVAGLPLLGLEEGGRGRADV